MIRRFTAVSLAAVLCMAVAVAPASAQGRPQSETPVQVSAPPQAGLSRTTVPRGPGSDNVHSVTPRLCQCFLLSRISDIRGDGSAKPAGADAFAPEVQLGRRVRSSLAVRSSIG